jgi:hypothetical protein
LQKNSSDEDEQVEKTEEEEDSLVMEVGLRPHTALASLRFENWFDVGFGASCDLRIAL